MKRLLAGQALLVLCCIFYSLWWYRGFRPRTNVNRIGGVNGILLLVTMALGIGGVALSLLPIPAVKQAKAGAPAIVMAGIIAYVAALLITKLCFKRIVTTELMLIIGWAVLEMVVICRLEAAGFLGGGRFACMCIVIAAAVMVSLILYVAYYRMEEMKAFFAAMVPLATEAAAMVILIVMVLIQ